MPRIEGEWQRDFSGGWINSGSPAGYRQHQVARALNARIEPDGSIRRRPGHYLGYAQLSARGWGGLVVVDETSPALGRRGWLVIIGTNAYLLNTWQSATPGSTTVGTSLPEDYWYHTTFHQGGHTYAILANGNTNVYKFYDRSIGFQVAAGYPSGVKYLATFNERVWYAGHSGVELVGTKIRDFEDHGTDAINLQIQTHDGDPDIMGLHAHRDGLLVFKRYSTSLVDGYGDSTIIAATGPRGVSRSVGCIAPRTIRAVGGDGVMWLSERGVELYRSGTGIQLASTLQPYFFNTVDTVQKTYPAAKPARVDYDSIIEDPDIPCAVYNPRRMEYRLAVPSSVISWAGDTRNDIGYVINVDTLAATEDDYFVVNDGEYPAIPASMFYGNFYNDPGRTVILNWHGEVLFEAPAVGDGAAGADNGADVTMRVRSRPFTFGDRSFSRVRARALEVVGEADIDSTVTLRAIVDGADGSEASKTMAETLIDGVKEANTRLSDRGRVIQAEIETTADIRITGIRMAAQPLKEIP